ncbi:MAG: helix-turn-helix transcriptional regulator [Clostridiales Family XIII bacterium]|nr:helix-turn-helix transcriptional regulator [Clostridiales Family XIII bacterium]
MKLGDILRNLLDEKDMSQKELAAELNMPQSTIGNYFRNEREADYETLKLFADYFGVSTDYLLDYHGKGIQSSLDNELLRIFRSLSPDQQELYIEQGRAFIIQNNKKEKSSLLTLRKDKAT